jgi:hypothetical protein
MTTELNCTTDRYEKRWQLVAKIIAHPHQVITPHDKHRAAVFLTSFSPDDDLIEYIYSQMNEDDTKQTRQILASLYD